MLSAIPNLHMLYQYSPWSEHGMGDEAKRIFDQLRERSHVLPSKWGVSFQIQPEKIGKLIRDFFKNERERERERKTRTKPPPPPGNPVCVVALTKADGHSCP